MKILFFVPTTGEADRDATISLPFVIRLCRALHVAGNQLTLVGHWRHGGGASTPDIQTEERDFCRLISIPVQGDLHSRLPFFSELHVTILKQILASEQPEVVHIYSPEFLRGSLAAALTGQTAPVVLTLTDFITICARYNLVRGDDTLCAGPESLPLCLACNRMDVRRRKALFKRALLGLPTGVWRWGAQSAHPRIRSLARSVLRAGESVREQWAGWVPLQNLVRAIIAPSRTTLELHRAHGWSRPPGHVIPWGMSQPDPLVLQQLPSLQGPLTLGFSGRLVAEKGLLELVQGMSAFVAGGGDCRLKIFCKPADLTGTLYGRQVLSAIAPLGERVECRQYDGIQAASIAEAMTGIDYLAVPSRWIENIPLVALEALVHGIPILVPAHSSLRELVTDGRQGVVFETDGYGRPTGLAEVFRQLTSALNRTRQTPRESLYGFSCADEAVQIVEIYRKILTAAGPAGVAE